MNSLNEVTYTALMDDTVGDFNYGEIGLYLVTGELFAVGVESTPQPKRKTTGVQVGNNIYIAAKILLSNIAPTISFPINEYPLAKALTVAKVSLLQPPFFSDSNMYLTGDFDDTGHNLIYAYRAADYEWSFPTHNKNLINGAVTGVSTTTNMVSTAIGTVLTDLGLTAGQYIMVMTSGALRGYSRILSAAGSNNCSWADAFATAPQVGDTFEIYQSGASTLLRADALLAAASRFITAFTPVPSSPPAMTVTVLPGAILDDGALASVAQQVTGAIAAPVGNPRIDRVVLDQRTGAVSVVTGTPAGSPTPPAIPAGKMPCAQVLLQPASTTITTGMITDERTFQSSSKAYNDATYLTIANAASTYLTQANAASTYLTQANAASTYLTIANAASTYSPLSTTFGQGQTWQNMLASRALGVTYTNTTGKPILVSVYGSGSGTAGAINLSINGIFIGQQGFAAIASGVSYATLSGVVPIGGTYIATNYSGASLYAWAELR